MCDNDIQKEAHGKSMVESVRDKKDLVSKTILLIILLLNLIQ